MKPVYSRGVFWVTLLALTFGIGAARADEAKLIFLSLVPSESPVLAATYHPWIDRINAAGKGLVHIEERDGYALANLDNIYNRVLDDVVQVAFAQQNAIAGKFIRSIMAGLPFVSGDSETASVALWRLEGYGVEEIAVRLSCAPRSVKRKLRLIRELWEGEVDP